MNSLFILFDQARKIPSAIYNKTSKMESVMNSGAKIQKFSDKIEILNMGKGGDYFKECSEEEYEVFYKYGWSIGADNIMLNNYNFKLKLIQEKIKQEVNTRKNDKHIQNLKNRREKILQKYTERKIKFNNKLNQIKNEQKVKNYQHKG